MFPVELDKTYNREKIWTHHLSRLILLPRNQIPTIITRDVTDVEHMHFLVMKWVHEEHITIWKCFVIMLVLANGNVSIKAYRRGNLGHPSVVIVTPWPLPGTQPCRHWIGLQSACFRKSSVLTPSSRFWQMRMIGQHTSERFTFGMTLNDNTSSRDKQFLLMTFVFHETQKSLNCYFTERYKLNHCNSARMTSVQSDSQDTNI
jgi:hypothetical protein